MTWGHQQGIDDSTLQHISGLTGTLDGELRMMMGGAMMVAGAATFISPVFGDEAIGAPMFNMGAVMFVSGMFTHAIDSLVDDEMAQRATFSSAGGGIREYPYY